jgi:FkbM family methyltransferase
VGRALVRRQVDAKIHYRSPTGLALRVDPSDHFQPMMLLGLFDPIVIDLVARYAKPGSVALDAGAHMGYLTLNLARAVGPTGQVHSFEPDPRLIERVVEHARVNGMDWVKVNQVAVSERSESGVTLQLPTQVGFASLREEVWDADRAIQVDAVSLDDYVQREGIDPASISFIKLDVEGLEFEALRGLDDTLRRSSASVLVEYIPARMRGLGQDPDELLAYMLERGYRPWAPHREADGSIGLRPGTEPGEGEDILFRKE